MAYRLKMAKIHAIEELLRLGWSHRRISRELGVNRETVSRYDRLRHSKPAISTPGSDPPVECGRKSHCEPYRALIEQRLEQGLSAQRIFQDLRVETGFKVDPLICPACGAEMKPIAFITDYEVIDQIIHHLAITFRTQRPPPPHQQEELY